MKTMLVILDETADRIVANVKYLFGVANKRSAIAFIIVDYWRMLNENDNMSRSGSSEATLPKNKTRVVVIPKPGNRTERFGHTKTYMIYLTDEAMAIVDEVKHLFSLRNKASTVDFIIKEYARMLEETKGISLITVNDDLLNLKLRGGYNHE